MKRSPIQRKTPMKQGGFARTDRKEAGAVSKLKRSMKSKGMVGRTPTAEEARFMDAMAAQGCLACAKDGIQNAHISLHHIDGRTKPGAHFLVIGLCAPHHQQDDSDPAGRISVHGSKRQFEEKYGTERELLAEARQRMEGGPESTAIEAGPVKTIYGEHFE